MDTNVIGRCSFWGGGEKPSRPRITRILVRGLTAGTHGNACGIGMADFTTARCAAEIDRAQTDVNCITSNCPEDARIPIACASDREAVEAAIHTAGVSPADVRLAWIRDTAHLERLAVSEELWNGLRARTLPAGPEHTGEGLRPAGPLFPLPYDESGDLRSPFA
jgi:hypothetical protein